MFIKKIDVTLTKSEDPDLSEQNQYKYCKIIWILYRVLSENCKYLTIEKQVEQMIDHRLKMISKQNQWLQEFMKTKRMKKDKVKRKYTSYINTHQSFELYEDETDN